MVTFPVAVLCQRLGDGRFVDLVGQRQRLVIFEEVVNKLKSRSQGI